MKVYVDEIRVWPNAKHRCFKAGSAHLTADTLDDLHAFARRLGLRLSWFQDHAILPHYDLSPRRHARALALGAELVPMRTQLIARRSKLATTRLERDAPRAAPAPTHEETRPPPVHEPRPKAEAEFFFWSTRTRVMNTKSARKGYTPATIEQKSALDSRFLSKIVFKLRIHHQFSTS